MRITIALAILVFSFALLGPCNLAFAQTPSTGSGQAATDSADITLEGLPSLDEVGAIDIGESLVHPASPLYFLKALRERLELLFATTTEAKMQRELEFAQRRLREIRALVKNKQQDLIPPTAERYKDHLQKAAEVALNNEDLNFKVGEAVSRHLDTLQRVYDQVGNPRAKQAILASIERVIEQNRTLLKKLDLVTQQKLIRETALRQALACKFLIRESSASGKTDTEKVALGEEVKKCQQNIRENLKDELMDIKQKKMMMQGSPSANPR